MKKLLWLVPLALLAISARQAYTITIYPQPDNVTCYGDPKPFACVHIPSSPTTGPRLTPTPQNRPTGTRTATTTIIPASPTSTASTATPFPPLALVNGDFEQHWEVGWLRFDRWPDRPSFNDERGHPESRHGGEQSLRLFNEYRCHLSGVYQTVSVPQFSTVRFRAWGRTWASYSSVFPGPSDLSVTDGIAVGIDERGGTNPAATGIIWVEASDTEFWREVTVQGVALSNRVTVFVQARLGATGVNACQWPLPFMVGFVDDASIEIVP